MLKGIAGGTMGANHPISFCKDFQGGRSFYTGLGTSAAAFDATPDRAPQGRDQLGRRSEQRADVSDCGATVLKNFQQVKVTQQPNLNEPIGFDQLPGRPHDPDRPSRRRAPAQPGDGHHAR